MFDYEIEAGLHLKPLKKSDAEYLYRLIQKSRDHLRTYLIFVDLTTRFEHTKQFVDESVLSNARGETFVTVIYKNHEIAGLVGFNSIDKDNRRAEIGYWLAEPFIGQGIMTKATRAIIAYGFDTLDLNRIDLKAATTNHKSRGVAKRLGFKEEGVIRDAEWIHDHYVDHVIYGLLKRDYHE